MDTPPVPKPRSGIPPQNDPLKKPVPLPRTKVPTNNDRVSATDIIRSISSVSKQISEDVAQKVTSSAKTANEKIEKSFIDGSRFAKGTLEKTIITSKAVRDSVTKSVIEGTRTAGLKLRRQKKSDNGDDDPQRCVSMPVVDVSLFDNIQFHSPLLEQKRYLNDAAPNSDLPSLHLNASNMDDLSLFSNNSDSNTDTDFSNEGRESDANNSTLNLENEPMTYDTPRMSRTNSITSTMSTPEVPERRKKRESAVDIMRQNSLYENWTLPHTSKPNVADTSPSSSLEDSVKRPSKSTIYEFDPLNTSNTNQKYAGVSNELILLESFLIGDTYGSIVTTDHSDDGPDYRDSEYFNPPTPPERSDSLCSNETTPTIPTTSTTVRDNNSNWFVDSEFDVKCESDEVKPTNSVMQRFSNMLKFDSKIQKPVKQVVQKVDLVERPSMNSMTVPYFCGTLIRIVPAMGEDLFKNAQTRYCVLSDQKFICYTDPNNSIVKEAYTLDSIYSLQIVLPLSSSMTSNSYCFELMVSSGGRSTPRKVLFSCASASERRNWAQKIVEHLTSGFPTKYTAEYTRCGWCYLKEGVTGEWRGAWVMLIRRVLVYYTSRDVAVFTVDLRKTRCVGNLNLPMEPYRVRRLNKNADNLNFYDSNTY